MNSPDGFHFFPDTTLTWLVQRETAVGWPPVRTHLFPSVSEITDRVWYVCRDEDDGDPIEMQLLEQRNE